MMGNKRDRSIDRQKSYTALEDLKNAHKKHKDNLLELGVLCAIVALFIVSEVIGSHDSINPTFALILGVVLMIGWYATRIRISYLTEKIHNQKRRIK
jgi:hypothetical protein